MTGTKKNANFGKNGVVPPFIRFWLLLIYILFVVIAFITLLNTTILVHSNSNSFQYITLDISSS